MNDQSGHAEPRDPRVEEALREYLERIDGGEAVNREEFISQNAEIAEALRVYIDAEEELRKLAGDKASRESAGISTRSMAAQGQETIAPQSAAKRAADAAGTGLTGQFGRYRIIRALGKGAMGAVYLAEDTQIERQVALKTPHFTEDPTGEQMERFFREARAAGNLRHPHICPIYDFGQIDGRHFITMAYIDGRPLSAFIQPDNQQAERQILIVVRKLAIALQEAHDHGIVHRDLKPANIMVDKKGEPIIMDFGLARQARRDDDIRLTQTGNILGTPAFMSPEQVEGEPSKIGPPTDQYSLGVILYELLTAQLPFRGTVMAVMGQILTKEPSPPSQLRRDLDVRIEAVCLKMMAKNPSERFRSLKAAADEISSILKSPAAKTATKEKTASSPSPPGGRKRADAGTSQALKSPKQKVLTDSDLASLEELARKCYSRRDFEQVIQIVERVPEERRNAGLQALLEKSRGKADEISFLICEIDEAVRLNDRQRALGKAEELLAIKPGHHRALKVQEDFGGYGEGGAARIGILDQFRRPLNDGGWIPWSVLALGLAVFGVMTGVIVIYLNKTAVLIDIQDPGVEVAVKGKTPTVTGPDQHSVKVIPGEQELTISSAGLETITKSFTLKRGERRTVTVSIINKEIVARLDNEIARLPPVPEEKTSPSAGPAKEADTAAVKTNTPQLLVAPFDEATAHKEQTAWAGHFKTSVEFSNAIGMKLVLIPPGEFQMGSAETRLPDDVRPVHRVRITKPFYMGVYEVTQEEFQRVMGANPSHFHEDPRLPVESMSAQHIQDFCRKLSAMPEEMQAGRTYRLPTEAEWEYACRAGTTTRFHFGDVMSSDQANFDGDNPGVNLPRGPSLGRTTRVGSYRPNAFGLYDMHGNVIEVVSDSYSADYYSTSPVDDPRGPSSGDLGIARGGGWKHPAVACAYRYSGSKTTIDPALGFRVVCDTAVLTASAIASPTTRKADYDSLATGKWIPVLEGEMDLRDRTVSIAEQRAGDVIIRARVKKISGRHLAMTLRRNSPNPGCYTVWFAGGHLFGMLKSSDDGRMKELGQWWSEANFDDRLEFAFSAVGEVLTVYADGKRIGEVRDRDHQLGSLEIGAFRGRSLFQNVEIMILDKSVPSTDSGFVPLFNGKDLTGWSVEYDDPKVWKVENGVIVAHGTNTQRVGYLLSNRDYGDFILRLEFNLDDHAASGVVLRGIPGELLTHPFGNRLRQHPVFMLEDQPERSEVTGTLHWVLDRTHVRPNRAAELSPPGIWNKLEIEVKGRSLRASVNGKPVSDVSLAESAHFNDKTVPSLNRKNGRIGLLKSYRSARFRKIEIKELSPQSSAVHPAADADRRAAEWAVSLGGTVRVREAQQETDVTTIGSLPSRFELIGIDIRGVQVPDAGLANLKGLTSLKRLLLWSAQVSDAGLAHVEGLTNLDELGLFDNPGVTDAGLSHVEGLTNLHNLDLNGTQVSDEGVARLKGLTNLTWLNLMNTGITGTGFVALKKMTQLEVLYLEGSKITDGGLANLQSATTLNLLGLERTQVSDAGLGHLKGLANLARLNLRATRVTDAGLVHIKGMRQLTELNLADTHVTAKGVAKLKAALPNCNITQ